MLLSVEWKAEPMKLPTLNLECIGATHVFVERELDVNCGMIVRKFCVLRVDHFTHAVTLPSAACATLSAGRL
jgi:hypothetical protein